MDLKTDSTGQPSASRAALGSIVRPFSAGD